MQKNSYTATQIKKNYVNLRCIRDGERHNVVWLYCDSDPDPDGSEDGKDNIKINTCSTTNTEVQKSNLHSIMFDFRKQCLNGKNIHVPVLVFWPTYHKYKR